MPVHILLYSGSYVHSLHRDGTSHMPTFRPYGRLHRLPNEEEATKVHRGTRRIHSKTQTAYDHLSNMHFASSDSVLTLVSENYFLLPLSTVRRKLSGTCDSLVASSVWKPPFRRALDTHPVYSVDMLEESVPICDACHIGGRVATQSFEVTGEAYNKETYRPLPVRTSK